LFLGLLGLVVAEEEDYLAEEGEYLPLPQEEDILLPIEGIFFSWKKMIFFRRKKIFLLHILPMGVHGGGTMGFQGGPMGRIREPPWPHGTPWPHWMPALHRFPGNPGVRGHV